MNIPFAARRLLLLVAIAALTLPLAACPPRPVQLKTLVIGPATFATGMAGFQGSTGYCLSAGRPPPSPFRAGPGQVMVGFDDFFKAGSDPFPCDDIRAVVFRAGVMFDLSQFDSTVAATLTFGTAASVSRGAGGTSTSPVRSVATTLGVGTQAFTNLMPDDNQATLPPGPAVKIVVSGQVRDWVDKSRPNFGFVVSGPRGPVSKSSPPKDNDAQLSWYQTFRLEIVYNPALNPRAPQ